MELLEVYYIEQPDLQLKVVVVVVVMMIYVVHVGPIVEAEVEEVHDIELSDLHMLLEQLEVVVVQKLMQLTKFFY